MGKLTRSYDEADAVRHEAVLRRVSEGEQRMRARRRRRQARTAKRLAAATVAVLALAVAWGLAIGPIGQFGFLAMLAGIVLAWVLILGMVREAEETPVTLAASDIAALPAKTEAWLQRQRPALPAPAVRLADAIGLKLEALAPQVAALDPREPAAAELRKLLATELPELVDGYQRVPQAMRGQERDGPSPDRQLTDGLGVIDAELAEMSATLASGDLRRLATQGRYLELKYKDDPEG
jgi:hypothetical protein